MVTSKQPSNIWSFAGTTAQVYQLEPGEGLPRHEHAFAHTTACYAGAVVVRKQGRERMLTVESQPLLLVANEWHEIEALSSGTVLVNTFASVNRDAY